MNLRQHIQEKHFKAVIRAGNDIGVPVFVVGGWVRDLLLCREVKDIDFVCEGSGIELARRTADVLGATDTVKVFKNFGTAMFKFGELELEFVGARRESYRSDSRKPTVEDGSIADDQHRRDFTINTLSISLNKDTLGDLIDPFGGLKDLEHRIIRTPLDPALTFSDDPLRMLRAIRFAAQLNFTIENKTLEGITAGAKRITIVSPERIADELNKMLLAPFPSSALTYLDHTGLLETLLPEVHALKGVEELEGQGHKENFLHTVQVVDNVAMQSQNLWLRWAALLHDIGKPVTKRFDSKLGWTFHNHEFVGSKMVPRVFKRLRLPENEKLKYVHNLVLNSSRPAAIADPGAGDSAVRRLLFEMGDDIDDLMTLAECDITSRNERLVKKIKEGFKRARQRLKRVEEQDHIRNFQPPLGGLEIAAMFGIPPGPQIGTIKNAIKEAILDGQIPNDADSARKFAYEYGLKMGFSPPS